MTPETKLARRAPAERKAAILDSAQELFLAQGVEATSIDSIARQAGVAKGTVYLYFPSKEHIVGELEILFNSRIAEQITSAIETSSPATAVEDWCGSFVSVYLDELSVHDMLFYGRGPTSREDIADNILIDQLAELLSAQGNSNSNELAALLIGGITLLVDRAVLSDQAAESAPLVKLARSFAASTVEALREP